MEQVRQISEAVSPDYTFLVVDAMTGQDAVSVAEAFHATLEIDGVILSKLDGDARGGAALSVKEVIGRPIAFASTGEKVGDFEQFHPDRMADRILGMGDVLTLIEKVEADYDRTSRPRPRRPSSRASSRSRTSSSSSSRFGRWGLSRGSSVCFPAFRRSSRTPTSATTSSIGSRRSSDR